MFLGLFLERQFARITDLRDGFGTALVDQRHRPAIAGPELQLLPQPLRQIARGVVGGDEFDATGLIGGQLQAGFDLDQQFHIAVHAD